MPTYEYLCEKCGHEFEREQRISEDPIKTCPQCKARKAKRLISNTSFVLKGGGWYSDGYASNSSKGAESAATKDSASEKTSNATSSDSKASSDSKKSTSSSDGKSASSGSN